MDTSERSEVLRETDHATRRRGNPRVDAVPQEFCSNEQTSPGNPVRPFVPGEGVAETFIDGSGI
jgi:hypothetical protein